MMSFFLAANLPCIASRSSRRNQGVRAFSLVEVTLSLGIVGFALVGIMGALPIAMNSERFSVEQTRSAAIAAALFTSLRAQPFTKALYLDNQLYGSGVATTAALDLSSANSGPFVCYSTTDESSNGSNNDSRLMHFYSEPQGDNCFQVVIRCNNQPASVMAPGSAATLANQVDLAIGSIGGATGGGAAKLLKTPFRFSSVIANRSL